MQNTGKVVIASQHFPPDPSTTAGIMSEIARHLSTEFPVLVLSGSPGSLTGHAGPGSRLVVVEIKNRMAAKAALARRAAAEILFTWRTFVMLLRKLRRGDVALTVTAPFMLPYAVAAAAWLRGARSVLILHDLYPDVMVMAGLLKPSSVPAMVIRGANALMYRALTAVVVIGRDAERPLSRYRGMTPDKIQFIPNWATIAPALRPVRADNPHRLALAARFVVGLSGNLGFTHDPAVVFEAARRLKEDPTIHFLLSGWGIGFELLKRLQSEACLPNVTLVGRVRDEDLETFLTAADAWIIPYRKDVAGVSVPSRFYNLLAVGRPVILVSEPEAEAALTVAQNHLGWVVTPGKADELANAIRTAAASVDPSMPQRAVEVAANFSIDRAVTAYGRLIGQLLQSAPPAGGAA